MVLLTIVDSRASVDRLHRRGELNVDVVEEHPTVTWHIVFGVLKQAGAEAVRWEDAEQQLEELLQCRCAIPE